MATAPKEITKTELQRSYVAVSSGYSSLRGPRRLPQVNEDVTGTPGPTVYEQMSCDSEVAAALLLLVYFILADGVQCAPAVGEKDDRYELAVEINQHIERTMCNLQRPLKETLEMIVKESMTHGNKVAEKVYAIPTTGLDAYKLVLSQIKVKPKAATAFVVDEFMNLVGLVPARSGYTPVISENSKVIPPEKFVIATYRMKDEDPRGNSLLRPAVKAWNLKQLGWPEFLTYALRCAVPGLAVILSDKAKDKITTDSQGNQSTLTAVDEALQALAEFKNSTAMVLESGSEIKALEVRGEGEFWERFFQIVNKEITKGILLQELATSDAAHQTKGSTASQMDIVELLVWAGKTWVAEIVRSQIYKPQVEYNYGAEIAAELTPKAMLGDYDRKSWDKDSDAVVGLCTATVIDENGNTRPLLTYSQIQGLLGQIGIAPPSEDEVIAMRAKASQPPQQQNNQQQANQ
jgi:hypothetical protein